MSAINRKPLKEAILLTALFVFFLIPFFSYSQKLEITEKENAWLEKHKDSLFFSLECNYAPFIFVGENDVPQGLYIDLTEEIEKILDIQFIYQKCDNLPNNLLKIKNQETDLVSAVKITSSRKTYMLFSEPFIEIPTVIVCSERIRDKLLLKDLGPYSVAVGSESSLFFFMKANFPNYQITTYNTEFECLDNLVLGKTDIVLTDAASYTYFKSKYNADNLKVTSVIPFSYNLAYGASLKNGTLINIINKAFTQIPPSRKEELLNKWIKLDIVKTYNFRNAIIFIISFFVLILIVLALVFAWNRTLNKRINKKTKQLRDELFRRRKSEENLLHLNEELKISKEKAEESDKLKTAFLRNLSHEIRTPMNGILGFSTLLKEPDLSSEDRDKYIDIVLSKGNYLIAILEDIIEMAQLETGQISVTHEIIDLNTLCKDLVRELPMIIPQGKNLELVLEKTIHEDKSIIKTDILKIRQILINLISNAIKYTPEGKIWIGCELMDDKTILFYVKDTGLGIDKKYQSIIFERFTQVDTNERIFQSGSGLGLAISKLYLDMLGGTIWVDSAIGEGSQFYFTIPYIKASNIPSESTSDHYRKLHTDSSQTILIAEDDEINLEFITNVLSAININLVQARNGIEAVEACQKNSFINIVLMDIKMPVMDGYEATKLIKQLRPQIKIIAQTAYALKDDKLKIISSGFDGYISKPIDKIKLLTLVQETLYQIKT